MEWKDAYRLVSAKAEQMILEEEGHALYEAARRATDLVPGILVEIGSYKGTSTAMLALGMSPGSMLIAIDPHDGVKDTTAGEEYPAVTIEPLRQSLKIVEREDAVLVLAAPSGRAFGTVRRLLAGRPIDVLFVDGSHTYSDALTDFMMYGPLLRPGGYLIADDLGYATVKQAYDRFMGDPEEKGRHFPFDLSTWGIVDPVHRRLHEGVIVKMAITQKKG